MRRPAFTLALVLAALAACGGEEIDSSGLVPVDDYGTWAYHDVYGPLPGHGESWRAIFINPVARRYTGFGPYPDDTVLVKEVRVLREVDGQPAAGDLKYIAIMRKKNTPPPGVPGEGGWIFTTKSSPDDPTETHGVTCWDTCHRQAPFAGVFFDYGKVGTDP